MESKLKILIGIISIVAFCVFGGALALATVSTVDTAYAIKAYLECSSFCTSLENGVVDEFEKYVIWFFVLNSILLGLMPLFALVVVIFARNSSVGGTYNGYGVQAALKSKRVHQKPSCVLATVTILLSAFVATAQFYHRSNDLLLLTSGAFFAITAFFYVSMETRKK